MTTIDLAATNTDLAAAEQLEAAMETIDAYYRSRGIFQDRFGFGQRPAILVVDFSYGFSDTQYPTAADMSAEIAATRRLTDVFILIAGIGLFWAVERLAGS